MYKELKETKCFPNKDYQPRFKNIKMNKIEILEF